MMERRRCMIWFKRASKASELAKLALAKTCWITRFPCKVLIMVGWYWPRMASTTALSRMLFGDWAKNELVETSTWPLNDPTTPEMTEVCCELLSVGLFGLLILH